MVEIAVKALSLVAVVGLALVLKRVGWASIRDFPLVSRLVLSVTLPCALLTSFNEYTLDTALLSLVLIGLVATSAQQVIGYLLARRRGRREQAFAVLNSGSFNIGAFGMPYLSGFMGPQAILYAALFDIGNAVGGGGAAGGRRYGPCSGVLDVAPLRDRGPPGAGHGPLRADRVDDRRLHRQGRPRCRAFFVHDVREPDRRDRRHADALRPAHELTSTPSQAAARHPPIVAAR